MNPAIRTHMALVTRYADGEAWLHEVESSATALATPPSAAAPTEATTPQPASEPVGWIQVSRNGERELVWSRDEELEGLLYSYEPLCRPITTTRCPAERREETAADVNRKKYGLPPDVEEALEKERQALLKAQGSGNV